MITVKKNGREVAAMVMGTPYHGVLGVVQCMIPGCEAQMPLLAPPLDLDTPAEQIDDFLVTHDCDPTRFQRRVR